MAPLGIGALPFVVVVAAVAVTTGCTGSTHHAAGSRTPTPALTGTTFPAASGRAPTCVPLRGTTRCTRYGELGRWDFATAATDGGRLTIHFTGLCGADPAHPYRATASEAARGITIAVYGPRPYSSLCAGAQTIAVILKAAAGDRRLIDAYDGRPRPLRH